MTLTYETEVAIVGAGPAGVILANLLGRYGVSVLVLEREKEVVDMPRAVGIDDAAIRTLQSFGMAEPILDGVIRNVPVRYYDSRGRLLAHVPPGPRRYGWPRRNLCYQPFLEQRLRANLARFATVELLCGAEVFELRQDSAGAHLRAWVGTEPAKINARFVIGADGGGSFVRKAVGIDLVGDTAASKWLIVDVEKDTWDAPYPAVYSSPRRPMATIPLPFAFRRFEFRIQERENPAEVSSPESVARLLSPFYPGSAPPEVVRSRVYLHRSLTAARFQSGQVFLVGDAAHQHPPLLGQGLSAGIRDVTNLAWKLGEVISGRAGTALLDTYDAERRDDVRAMGPLAARADRMYRPGNVLTERVRNDVFQAAHRVPRGREYLTRRRRPVPRYTRGAVLDAANVERGSLVGREFPQPTVRTRDGARAKLDDVLGSRPAVLGLVPEIADRLSPGTAARLAAAGGLIVQAHVDPVYRRAGQAGLGGTPAVGELSDVYDVHGELRDLRLERPADEVYFIRPDRYVACACPASRLDSTLGRVLDALAYR
ncbi:MAG TPA: bifunctional 3-(3-hydroxy-phenyl)propionate/3-hydroxycinnamic acid hydroxylase [Amycolatopsis sp.]|nr:bifunctional 3-(3-hydroxy-phenyl)propionate/3-hydroxycinnamic acid hydroxylase [Amycolatopsis sp.]